MNTLHEIIKEMEVDFSWACERYSFNLEHGYFATAEKYERLKKALEKYIPKLTLLLSDKPTVAITETAHCANTLLSECADSEDGQVIGVVGAGSSETEIVKQNEQTKELCPKCHADEFEHRRFGKICCSCKTWFAY
jgi:hypothetical protein